jgi:hypothetical protein
LYRCAPILFAVLVVACRTAASQVTTEPEVCAVLARGDAQPPGLLQLVEFKTGQLPGVSLVERQEVAKVLREQQLAAMGAERVRDRMALGRLLRADVLVLLDVRHEPVKGIEVVVADTSRGVRLVHGERVLARLGSRSPHLHSTSRTSICIGGRKSLRTS